jgi:hypothetical protein
LARQGNVAAIAVALFDCAAAKLTDGDLLTLSERVEQAADLMGHIATVCSGLACLLANDSARAESVPGAGNFRSAEEVAPLLLGISAMSGQAEAMARLAMAADHEDWLRKRRSGRET